MKLKIVEKSRVVKPGQVNEYIIKLPSELRKVQEMIKKGENQTIEKFDDSKEDFYTVIKQRG